MRTARRFVALVVIFGAVAVSVSRQRATHSTDASPGPQATTGAGADDALGAAFREHRSNVQVTGAGVVDRVLADDRDGSPHQRFILRLPTGQTVLIAHNLDLAPRLTSLDRGDTVRFAGEYEWNDTGGVVHWTHRDPSGRHRAGWLEHEGQRVQ